MLMNRLHITYTNIVDSDPAVLVGCFCILVLTAISKFCTFDIFDIDGLQRCTPVTLVNLEHFL